LNESLIKDQSVVVTILNYKDNTYIFFKGDLPIGNIKFGIILPGRDNIPVRNKNYNVSISAVYKAHKLYKMIIKNKAEIIDSGFGDLNYAYWSVDTNLINLRGFNKMNINGIHFKQGYFKKASNHKLIDIKEIVMTTT